MDLLSSLTSTPVSKVDANADDLYIGVLRSMLEATVFKPIEIEGREGLIDVVPPQMLQGILSDENMREHFVRAFTHRSWRGKGAKYTEGYDRYELFGDTLGNAFIAQIVMAEHGHRLTTDELSKMISYYKSNKVFGEFMITAMPSNILRAIVRRYDMNSDLEPKVYADVFEAMLAAIFYSANNVQRGMGGPCVENALRVLTRNFRPDIVHSAGNPKSQIQEIFGDDSTTETPPKLNKKQERNMGSDEKERFRFKGTITVRVDDKKKDELFDKYFPALKDRFAGPLEVTSDLMVDRPSARDNAYAKLVAMLNAPSVKINTHTLAEAKMKAIIDSHPQKALINSFLGRRNETLLLQKQDSGQPGMKDWDLVVQDANKERHFVASVTVSKDSDQWHVAKNELLDEYLLMVQREVEEKLQ